jgi:hypothetical protein
MCEVCSSWEENYNAHTVVGAWSDVHSGLSEVTAMRRVLWLTFVEMYYLIPPGTCGSTVTDWLFLKCHLFDSHGPTCH